VEGQIRSIDMKELEIILLGSISKREELMLFLPTLSTFQFTCQWLPLSATQIESVGVSAHTFIYPSIHLFTVRIP